MSNPSGLTTYKKQEGVLGITQDRKTLEWTPTNGGQNGKPTLSLGVSNVTNLQQTPATSAKVMLKVFTQSPGQTEQTAHVFQFISPTNARGEADTIKAALSAAIQAVKAAADASSAAMAIAGAVSSGPGKGKNVWEDDDSLKSDSVLQQSLFKADPALKKTFMESLRTKPEGITTSQFTAQFWSTRIHLLRAHAIEKSQTRGSYNVLSTLKPSEQATRMNVTREQMQLIFSQHPLVRKVYDREVPQTLNEHDFWSKFFQSKLLKKLRGERIEAADLTDKVFDRYLDDEQFTGRSNAYDATIPRIIDLEGNEENHSQRKGNAPEISLRPRANDKVPIIRTLNNLSEKIMSQVAPSDIDPSQPIGMDETTYNNLRLRDLQGDPEQTRVILKVRDQSQFFSDNAQQRDFEDPLARSRKEPGKAITSISQGLAQHFPQPGIGALQASDDAGSSDSVNGTGVRPSDRAKDATAHIFELIHQHRRQTEAIPSSLGLPTVISERVILTHATTTEFLHQFWSAFLSGKPDRVPEIASLVDSLNRALDRIQAVADDAEKERENEIKERQRQAREREQRTGRKQRADLSTVTGGATVVRQLLEPTMNSLSIAVERYKQALAEQMVEKEDG